MQYIETIPISETVHNFLIDLVALCFNNEPWRYSALGILEKFPTKDLRINIWDTRLRAPDIQWAGLVHSHKFEMTSYCIFGSLRQSLWSFTEDNEGEFSIYDGNTFKYNARVENTLCEFIDAGFLYHQLRYDIHSTDSQPLAVTVMHWKGPLERDLTVCLKEKGFTHKVYHPGDLAIGKTLKEVRDALGS